MKTGFSLCTFPNMEKPLFITGIAANVNRFFPVWEKYTGKTLFWPCTGPVRDCSVPNHYFYKKLSLYIKITSINLGLGFEFIRVSAAKNQVFILCLGKSVMYLIKIFTILKGKIRTLKKEREKILLVRFTQGSLSGSKSSIWV